MSDTPNYEGVEETPDEDQLRILHNLVERLVLAESEEDRLEAEYVAAKKVAHDLRENAIPEQMKQLGLKELTTDKGVYVEVKKDVRASFFAKDPSKREPAFAWLKENGHDGLVKNVVAAKFGKEQENVAAAFLEHCRKFDIPVDVEQSRDIHNQTLCAFLRSEIREGHPPPLELFGAAEFTTTKIKVSK